MAAVPVMTELLFEDLVAGRVLPDASLTVTAEDAAFFADAFAPGVPDPRDRGPGGTPLAGQHVAALGMRLLFEAVVGHLASMGAPGVDEVTWPHPVRVGDTLRFTARVTATRISASRPEMGLVAVAISLSNQHEVCVMTQSNTIMVKRRGREEARNPEART